MKLLNMLFAFVRRGILDSWLYLKTSYFRPEKLCNVSFAAVVCANLGFFGGAALNTGFSASAAFLSVFTSGNWLLATLLTDVLNTRAPPADEGCCHRDSDQNAQNDNLNMGPTVSFVPGRGFSFPIKTVRVRVNARTQVLFPVCMAFDADVPSRDGIASFTCPRPCTRRVTASGSLSPIRFDDLA